HAMTGDRERCIAAGMDDYITKPLHPIELVDAVERTHEERSTAQSRPVEPRAAMPAFEMENALARLGGDRKLLREMVTSFLAESIGLMKAIREAAATGDLAAVRRAAHTLKGALGTLGAPRAFEAVRPLEDAARQDPPDIQPAMSGFERELTDLQRALQ